jgi:hypothetical protein
VRQEKRKESMVKMSMSLRGDKAAVLAGVRSGAYFPFVKGIVFGDQVNLA